MSLNFSNTEIAFANKSNKDLRKSAWLFFLMSKPKLVDLSSRLGLWAIKNKIPFATSIVKNTIFDQFCGGTSLQDCQNAIKRLAEHQVQSVLDYGAEAKSTDEEFNRSTEEFLRAIKFAANEQSIPIVTMKITGLIKSDILEKIQSNSVLSLLEKESFKNLLKRLNLIGQAAEEHLVGLFIDAEESWIQDAVDDLASTMMKNHNTKKVIVYNTFQMYRHDRLEYLKISARKAKENNYLLGAKIVRGAYMEKERARALDRNYTSPIHRDKAATDKDFNLAISYCIENHQHISSYNASHNLESNTLQAELIINRGIDKQHPHVNFCQLYGMSDQITFNLSSAGFNVMKYLPYGDVREVIPYLIRRAQENTSVSDEVGREYDMIVKERRRRRSSAT